MGVLIRTTRVVADTGGGTQNIVAPGFSSQPKAVFFIISRCTSDGTAQDYIRIGVGATDGTNEWSFATYSEHGEVSSKCGRASSSSRCITYYGSASIAGQAEFSSWYNSGADYGVTINWTTTPPAGYLITCVFFGGADLSADAHTGTLGNQDVELNVTDPGFEPDVNLLALNGLSSFTTGTAGAVFSLGFAHNDGSDTQRALAWASQGGSGTSVTNAILESDRIAAQIYADAQQYSVECTNFDANGYSLYPRGGNSGDVFGCLSLNFGGVKSVKVATYDTPTSTGADAETGWGLTPEFCLDLQSMVDAVDTLKTDGQGGVFAVSAMDASNQYCTAIAEEDAQGTTDNQSIADDQASNVPQHDGSAGFAATLTSFDSDGRTLNFSATMGSARKWAVLAIGGTTWKAALASREVTIPSYGQGFARSQSDAANPGLWDGLQQLWLPFLGQDSCWDTGVASVGRLTDISGHGRDAELRWLEPAQDWGVSQYGGNLSFTGYQTRDYLKGGVVNPTTALTMWCVFRPRSTSSTNPGLISKYVGYGENTRSFCCFLRDTNKPEVALSADGTYQSANNVQGSVVNMGQWLNLVVTYQSGDATRMYYNGVLEASNGTCPASLYNSTKETTFGLQYYEEGDPDWDDYLYDGDLAALGIWDRALTPSEIQQLYADPHALVQPRRVTVPVKLPAAATTWKAALASREVTVPSYGQGFARNASEAKNPGLWDGLKAAWQTSLGATGSVLIDSFGTHDGAITYGTPTANWITSEFGPALRCNGGPAGYVNFSDVLDMGTDSQTVSMWVRTTDTSGTLIAKSRYAAADNRWYILIDGSALHATLTSSAGNFTANAGDVGRDGKWHHVCARWNRTGNLDLWVDGVLKASDDISAAAGIDVSTGYDLMLGRYNDVDGTGPHSTFGLLDGNIANVAIWRRAITSNEIQTLYADPHALVQPRRVTVPVVVPAAAGRTGNIIQTIPQWVA